MLNWKKYLVDLNLPRFCIIENNSSRKSLRFGLSSISYNWKTKIIIQLDIGIKIWYIIVSLCVKGWNFVQTTQ